MCPLSDNMGIHCKSWHATMTIWRIHTARWMPKATDIYSAYVILSAFPLQQWLHEHASMLRYT